jgi:hypothetical protein
MNKTISLLFTLGLLLGAPWLSTSGTANADEEKRTTTTIREKQLGDDLDADDDKTVKTREKIVKKTHGHHHDDDAVTVTRKKTVTKTEGDD